jgi:hypothetical protein
MLPRRSRGADQLMADPFLRGRLPLACRLLLERGKLASRFGEKLCDRFGGATIRVQAEQCFEPLDPIAKLAGDLSSHVPFYGRKSRRRVIWINPGDLISIGLISIHGCIGARPPFRERRLDDQYPGEEREPPPGETVISGKHAGNDQQHGEDDESGQERRPCAARESIVSHVTRLIDC